jgi:hypothetical protein
MEGGDEATSDGSSEGSLSDEAITKHIKDNGEGKPDSQSKVHERLRGEKQCRLSPRQGAMLLQDDDEEEDSDQNGEDYDEKAGVDDRVIKTTKTKRTKEREAAKAEIAKEKERHTNRKKLFRVNSTLELSLGTYIDVLDACQVWREAKIVDKRESDGGGEMEVQIGYIGWLHHWDEWLPVSSDRIQPYHSKTVEGHGTEYVDAPSSEELTTESEEELEKYDPAALRSLKQGSSSFSPSPPPPTPLIPHPSFPPPSLYLSPLLSSRQGSRQRTSKRNAGVGAVEAEAKLALLGGVDENGEEYTADTLVRQMRRREEKRRAAMSWADFVIYNPDFAMTMLGAFCLLSFVLIFHQSAIWEEQRRIGRHNGGLLLSAGGRTSGLIT